MYVFSKDALADIARKAMRDAGITDQGEDFVQTVAERMYRIMIELEDEV